MIEYINWNIDNVIFHIGSFELRYYSISWLLAFVLGFIIVRESIRKDKLNPELAYDLLWYVAIGTMLGARLGHCLFYDWDYFSHNILEIIIPISFTSEGIKLHGYAGLASHGGAIGICIALYLFKRKFKIGMLYLLDKIALAAPVAGALIRIGNFFNSEIIGAPSDMPWAVVFQAVDNVPRHPSQLYEAISYLIIFCVLIFVNKQSHKYKNGLVFGTSVSLIFITRILIEFTKEVQVSFEDGLREVIGLDMGQILSIPFIVLGLICVVRSLSVKKH
ncbi:MAG: prolipoprotein diacylglyceryl transferase [Bacteroidales bacterium]|nr:prolipoprotein diacylglyceryl transferase [Candidatus Egerieousia equi]